MTTRCAVLGSPIAHSLSPVLHRAAYAELGLDWQYTAHEVSDSELPAFLAGLDETWRGLSLTMPLKRAVVPMLDELSDRAAQAQAVNTVILEPGRRTGHNTDIPGAVAAVRERTDLPLRTAVIVGGGATASSTLLALADLGCTSVRVVVRDTSRVEETLEAAGRHPARPMVEVLTFREAAASAEALRPAIVVSTVPAEAQGEGVSGRGEGGRQRGFHGGFLSYTASHAAAGQTSIGQHCRDPPRGHRRDARDRDEEPPHRGVRRSHRAGDHPIGHRDRTGGGAAHPPADALHLN